APKTWNENSEWRDKAIMLFFDIAISRPQWGRQDAIERSDRTQAKAARPPRIDGRGTSWKYAQSGGALEHDPTRNFPLNCGIGARFRCAAPRPQPSGHRADAVRSRATPAQPRCIR